MRRPHYLPILLFCFALGACQQAERRHFDYGYTIRGNPTEMSAREAEPAYIAIANASLSPKNEEKYDKPPRVLRAPQPVMPTKDIIEGHEGEVVVEVFFNERGTVETLKLVRSTKSSFTAAVFAAVGQWQVEPPIKAGAPVPFTAIQRFKFRAER